MKVARLAIILELAGTGLWGAGKETFEADMTTYKLPYLTESNEVLKLPAIPGSYIKGLLRTVAYKIAGLLINAGLVDGVDPIAQRCWVGSTCGKCVVCQIFGSSGQYQSSVYVSHFYPVKKEALAQLKNVLWHEFDVDELVNSQLSLTRLNLTQLAHVKIDNRSWKAEEGGLFVIERVKPKATFLGEIRLYKAFIPSNNLSLLHALRLILLSLAQLNYTFVGRRTRAKISLLKYKPLQISQDSVCKEVLNGLEWHA